MPRWDNLEHPVNPTARSPLVDQAPVRETGISVSVIVPVRNSPAYLGRCLEAILASAHAACESIVVDDASTDDTRAVARRFPIRLIELSGGPYGPGYARNRGAEVARGDVVLFVDADVIITPDTIGRVVETMTGRPQVAAVFGSYDDGPGDQEFLSQYKNLFHHFVHQQANEEAATFWAGCGAVRREVFLALGGFDVQRYPRPCIEDIELGYRLRAAGYQIALNKQIQVKHLKRWTLRGMIRTDVIDRGIPWTLLILQHRALPNDLNLRTSQRASALLVWLLAGYLAWLTVYEGTVRLPLLIGLIVVMTAGWSRQPPHYSLGVAAVAVAALLAGGIALAALSAGDIAMLAALVLFPGAVAVGRLLRDRRAVSTHASLGAAVLGSVVVWVQLQSRLPWPVAVVGLALVLAVVALNYRFYEFFTRKRGLVFAAAVVPFHMIYFLYSVTALVLGFALHAVRSPGLKPGSIRARQPDARGGK